MYLSWLGHAEIKLENIYSDPKQNLNTHIYIILLH